MKRQRKNSACGAVVDCLDDDLLEAVKDELIYAKKLAVDEENRVLVWRGDSKGTAAVTSLPAQSTQQLPTWHEQPTQGVPAPREPHTRSGKTATSFPAPLTATPKTENT
jgi:hypothetical protein